MTITGFCYMYGIVVKKENKTIIEDIERNDDDSEKIFDYWKLPHDCHPHDYDIENVEANCDDYVVVGKMLGFVICKKT